MNTERKQIRLSIPVKASEKEMARKLVKAKVDGARNVTELVKQLLADRFRRYMEDQRTAKGSANLIGRKTVAATEPARVHSAGDSAAKSAKGGAAENAPSATGLSVPVASNGPGRRAGRRAKSGGMQDRLAQLG
jgi:hypothetical protein